MNCKHINKLLIPYLESELSVKDRASVEAHLEECDGCRKEKVLLEKTWMLLDGVKTPGVSGNFTANLMTRIRQEKDRRARPFIVLPEMDPAFALRVLAPAIATVCVIAGIYVFSQKYAEEKVPDDTGKYSLQRPAVQADSGMTEGLSSGPASINNEEPAAIVGSGKTSEAKISPADEEIVRNLDAYENAELYQNYAAINDLDVVDNIGVTKVH